MKKTKIHITLPLPDDLNAWVNFKSKKQNRSKRNFLLLLVEQAREIDLARCHLKNENRD
ncbi:hypothetical protein ACMSYV_003730 [Proteus mirabilis]